MSPRSRAAQGTLAGQGVEPASAFSPRTLLVAGRASQRQQYCRLRVTVWEAAATRGKNVVGEKVM